MRNSKIPLRDSKPGPGATGGTTAGSRAGRVRVRDMLQRDGVVLDSPDDDISPEATLLAGQLLNQELRRGLFIHGGNVIEQHAFTATSRLPEGLSCIFFLDGQVDVEIGGRRFAFQGDQRGAMAAAAVMNVAPESFQRMSMGRQHVHHLVVSATPEWLNLEGIEEARAQGPVARLFKEHLADHRWTPTPRIAGLVRDIFAPSTLMPELQALYLEGRAVEIVAETIAAVMRADRRTGATGPLTHHETIRLQRAREAIAASLDQPLSVEAIARAAGISASGLQRLFRLSEGRSVFEHVRHLRLDRALSALQDGRISVQEASAIAGYSSPANFATAFRRRYGMTPREALRPPLS